MSFIISWVVEMEFLSSCHIHHDIEQQELTSSQGADHYATSPKPDSCQLLKPDFLGDSHQTG